MAVAAHGCRDALSARANLSPYAANSAGAARPPPQRVELAEDDMALRHWRLRRLRPEALTRPAAGVACEANIARCVLVATEAWLVCSVTVPQCKGACRASCRQRGMHSSAVQAPAAEPASVCYCGQR